ncbi:SH3 domain-containing protein [Zafaria cholistanensis]|nr:SH3 domain-containing protein [Zafaria cholistanensis]
MLSERLLSFRPVAAVARGTVLLLLATQAVAAPAAAAATEPNASVAVVAAAPATGITTANLKLRTGAGTTYRAITTLPKGTRVKLVAKKANGWRKVAVGTSTGWVSGSYLTLSPKATTNALGYVSRGLTFRDKGPNKSSRVVLTFDDCPKTLAAFDAVLKYAHANNIGLVIAPTGACISSFRSRHGVNIAARARAKGQWVINHSVDHPDLRPLSCAAAAAQLKGTGVRSNYGRPPYGAIDGSVECAYAAVGMNIWTWNVDTEDWRVKSRALTVSRAVNRASAGSTVLMHMQWHGFSPEAIGQIKAGLGQRGLKLCRAYRGTDNAGAIIPSPRYLPSSLPC